MKIKNIKGVLIINWKTGALKVGKRNPTNIKVSELLINIDIDVEIPSVVKHNLTGKIALSQTQIKEFTTDLLKK